MPTIAFLGGSAGPAVTALGEGRLVDVCDEAHAPVAFSCRGATCGTCRVEVVEGAELLEPPGEDEVALLEEKGAPADQRLACQAVVRAGAGLVRLRWVGMGDG